MKRFDHLVIYRKQLGDVLLLQPALELLATQGTVALSCQAELADLVTLMPGPVAIPPKWFPKTRHVSCLDFRRSALLYAAQTVGSRRTLMLTRDTAPWWQSFVFDKKIIVASGNTYRAAMFYQAFGGELRDFRPPRLAAPPSSWQIPELPSNYGVIHPTSAWRRKAWQPQRWLEALNGGLNKSLHWIVSSGPSPWEVELAETVAAGLGRYATSFAGKTSLRQYLSLLANAKLVLCVDGSASHIASAFGKPTLTLFGPTNPVHWHWPTEHSIRLWAADYSCEKKPAVDAIPTPVVKQAVDQLLEVARG